MAVGSPTFKIAAALSLFMVKWLGLKSKIKFFFFKCITETTREMPCENTVA